MGHHLCASTYIDIARLSCFIIHACAMLQGFETNALGSFGGGPESTEAWRQRVDAQDAFSAAAAAKSAALHRKEEALVARRGTLAQLEAAVNAVTAEEALASASAAAAQAALGDLEAHAQVSICDCPILSLDSPPYML